MAALMARFISGLCIEIQENSPYDAYLDARLQLIDLRIGPRVFGEGYLRMMCYRCYVELNIGRGPGGQ